MFLAITGVWQKIIQDTGPNIYPSPYTTVPGPRAKLISEKFGDRKDQLTEAGKYYSLYHVDPSWKVLSCKLYRARETVAVDLAKPHIQTVTGMYSLHLYMYKHVCTLYVHVFYN